MITGTITRVDVLSINDEPPKMGIFIECSGADCMEIHRSGMYGQRVIVREDRRGHNRARGPAFRRLPPMEMFSDLKTDLRRSL